jgi:hypothetical protein
VRRGQRRVEDAPDRPGLLARALYRKRERVATAVLAGLAARAGYDCCPEKMARLAVRLAEALLRELRGG